MFDMLLMVSACEVSAYNIGVLTVSGLVHLSGDLQ